MHALCERQKWTVGKGLCGNFHCLLLDQIYWRQTNKISAKSKVLLPLPSSLKIFEVAMKICAKNWLTKIVIYTLCIFFEENISTCFVKFTTNIKPEKADGKPYLPCWQKHVSNINSRPMCWMCSKSAKKRKQSTGGVLHEKMFLKILQNSRENTCDRVSFLIKLQASAWHR